MCLSFLRRSKDTIDVFQSSSTDLTVNWKSFIDVEEEGNSVHSSGIAFYEIALGKNNRTKS